MPSPRPVGMTLGLAIQLPFITVVDIAILSCRAYVGTHLPNNTRRSSAPSGSCRLCAADGSDRRAAALYISAEPYAEEGRYPENWPLLLSWTSAAASPQSMLRKFVPVAGASSYSLLYPTATAA
jgi:hypothetical protein